MSIGYLLALVTIGGFTLISLWPPQRPRPLARLAYLMGLTVNEVPHLAAGLPLAAAAIQTVASGVDADWTLPVAAAGTAAVGVGIVEIARRGTRAWPVVAAAVESAGMEAPRRPQGWVWRTLLTPIPRRPRQLVRIADIPYGHDRRQRLDVYHRRGRPAGGPVLVYLHPGGYYSGDKHREGRALLHRLAERGWVCISANYRLRRSAGFEDHLSDARRALAWAKGNATRYGGDPERVVMAGSSAGAHLTSLLALDPSTRLAAAICLYGYYGRYYGRTASEPVASTPLAGVPRGPSFVVWVLVWEPRALCRSAPHGEWRPPSRVGSQLRDQHHLVASRTTTAGAQPTAEQVAVGAAALDAALSTTWALVHDGHDINGHDVSPWFGAAGSHHPARHAEAALRFFIKWSTGHSSAGFHGALKQTRAVKAGRRPPEGEALRARHHHYPHRGCAERSRPPRTRCASALSDGHRHSSSSRQPEHHQRQHEERRRHHEHQPCRTSVSPPSSRWASVNIRGGRGRGDLAQRTCLTSSTSDSGF